MDADDATPRPGPAGLSRIERFAGAVVVAVLAVLAIAEPEVLRAPFENSRTMLFTAGGALLTVGALAVMVRFGVPPLIRLLVVGVPFVAASWWVLSPFFRDDVVVDDDFETSIASAAEQQEATSPAPVTDPSASSPSVPSSTAPVVAAGPRLLGAGTFVGLAGHEGMGDAGFFELADGSLVLRLERFDIENGPDLRLYVVPGEGQISPGDGSVYLGHLRGNVGDQTYELPPDLDLTPGAWTVLVWCEAFAVEFVAATVGVEA
jgi:hypothetical protein